MGRGRFRVTQSDPVARGATQPVRCRPLEKLASGEKRSRDPLAMWALLQSFRGSAAGARAIATANRLAPSAEAPSSSRRQPDRERPSRLAHAVVTASRAGSDPPAQRCLTEDHNQNRGTPNWRPRLALRVSGTEQSCSNYPGVDFRCRRNVPRFAPRRSIHPPLPGLERLIEAGYSGGRPTESSTSPSAIWEGEVARRRCSELRRPFRWPSPDPAWCRSSGLRIALPTEWA
jgi:hypothetical protein